MVDELFPDSYNFLERVRTYATSFGDGKFPSLSQEGKNFLGWYYTDGGVEHEATNNEGEKYYAREGSYFTYYPKWEDAFTI